jgi:hypothetical protein
MDALLRSKSPIGAAQMSDGPDMLEASMFEPGTCVNGGIWPSLNQTLDLGAGDHRSQPWPGMSGRKTRSRATPTSIRTSGTQYGAAPTPTTLSGASCR